MRARRWASPLVLDAIAGPPVPETDLAVSFMIAGERVFVPMWPAVVGDTRGAPGRYQRVKKKTPRRMKTAGAQVCLEATSQT